MRTPRIAVIRGDGIGPEIVDAALRVLDAISASEKDLTIEIKYEDGGAAHYQRTGVNLDAEALAEQILAAVGEVRAREDVVRVGPHEAVVKP